MDTPKHSPEPWKQLGEISAIDANGDLVFDNYGPEPENTRRIIAAINFCRQFPTEFLEQHMLDGEPHSLIAVPSTEVETT